MVAIAPLTEAECRGEVEDILAPASVSKWGKDDSCLDFLCQDARVPFFFLTLFIEFSPSYGHAMALPVNFRKVDLNEITRKEGTTSLLETLAKTSDNSVLDQTMFVYPYEVATPSAQHHVRSDLKEGDHPSKIKSLIRGNYCNGDKEKHGQLELDVSLCCAARVTLSAYVTTCRLFKTTPRQFEDMVLNGTHSFNDWSQILKYAHLATGASKDSIRSFVSKLQLENNPLDGVGDDTPLEEYHRLVREAIQRHTPLRFAMIEGNHRMEALVRLFYGVRFDTLSLPVFQNHYEKHDIKNREVVMFKRAHVRICDTAGKEGFIHDSDLPQLCAFSKYLTSKRKQLVKSSWRHLCIDALSKVTELRSWKEHMSSARVVWLAKPPSNSRNQYNTKWGEHQKKTACWLLEFMLRTEPSMSDIAPESNSSALSNLEASIQKYDSKVLFCPYTALQNGYPDFNQAKRNNKIKCFKSIQPSVVMWLAQVFGSHKESFHVLQQFLQTPDPYMKDLQFLAMYVCGPVNRITELVHGATNSVLEARRMYTYRSANASKLTANSIVDKQRLEHYIRVSYGIEYLHFLTKFRMSFQFDSGSKNGVLLKWMKKGDLGYDSKSKNMLKKYKALAYDNATKVILSGFVRYVETVLQKKNKMGLVSNVSQWWKGAIQQETDVCHVARTLFPSLRSLHEDQKKYDGNLEYNDDFIGSLIPPLLRFSKENIQRIQKGDIDLTMMLKPTDFMSQSEQTRWLKEKTEVVLSGEVEDDEAKRVLMDTFDEKSIRILNTIKAAHVDLTQSSDESSNGSNNDETKQHKSTKEASGSPSKVIDQQQFSAFENICKEVQTFVSESPIKTTAQSKKMQNLIHDYASYTKDLFLKFRDTRQIVIDTSGTHGSDDETDTSTNSGSSRSSDSYTSSSEDSNNSEQDRRRIINELEAEARELEESSDGDTSNNDHRLGKGFSKESAEDKADIDTDNILKDGKRRRSRGSRTHSKKHGKQVKSKSQCSGTNSNKKQRRKK